MDDISRAEEAEDEGPDDEAAAIAAALGQRGGGRRRPGGADAAPVVLHAGLAELHETLVARLEEVVA